MNGSQPGLVGGLVGACVGLLGRATGTVMGIRSTNGPLERRFTIRASVIAWLLRATFLAGLILLPQPYNWLL